MKDKARIFISSTLKDLREEREAVDKALRRIQDTSIGSMEYFGSRDEAPEDASLAEVNRSTVYLGIFGHLYGSGITEAEYQRARERNLPCLIYIKDDSVPVPPTFVERDPGKMAKLEALRNEITANHTFSFFTSPDQLATQVVTDVHNLLGGTPRVQEELSKQQEPPKYGSKYQIHINHAENSIIGDGAQITHYHSTAAMDEVKRRSESREQVPKIDVLLVTVAEIEANTVLNLLKERFQRTFKRYAKGNKTYYDMGEIGGARTFMVQSEQGTGGPSGVS